MQPNFLSPVKEWHTNSALGGIPELGVADLPITTLTKEVVQTDGSGRKTSRACMSVWQGGWIPRLRFLLTGKIYLEVWGQTHPPVAVFIGSIFKEKK